MVSYARDVDKHSMFPEYCMVLLFYGEHLKLSCFDLLPAESTCIVCTGLKVRLHYGWMLLVCVAMRTEAEVFQIASCSEKTSSPAWNCAMLEIGSVEAESRRCYTAVWSFTLSRKVCGEPQESSLSSSRTRYVEERMDDQVSTVLKWVVKLARKKFHTITNDCNKVKDVKAFCHCGRLWRFRRFNISITSRIKAILVDGC